MEFILNIPSSTLYILLGVVTGAICALHIISGCCGGILSKILQYVNIFLHILLFCLLLLADFGITYSLAFFMALLYLYVSVNAISRKRKARKETGCDI